VFFCLVPQGGYFWYNQEGLRLRIKRNIFMSKEIGGEITNIQKAVVFLQCNDCGGDFVFDGEEMIGCLGCQKKVSMINGNIFQFEKNDISKDIMENTMYGPESNELKKELLEEKPSWLLTEEKRSINDGMIALDYGCGSSRQVFDFSNYAKAEIVFGLDFDLAPLIISSHISKELGRGNIFFVQYSSKNIPFKDGVFDVVSAHQVLEHLSDPQGAVIDISRKMKKDALFEADFPNGHSLGEIMRHFFHKIIKKDNPHISRINLKKAMRIFKRADLAVTKFVPDQAISGPVIYFYEGFVMRFLRKKNKLWTSRKKFKRNFLLRVIIRMEKKITVFFPKMAHNFRFILKK
jgi:ubiquinone/menaquinone biosynthesis C-methylase UbiE